MLCCLPIVEAPQIPAEMTRPSFRQETVPAADLDCEPVSPDPRCPSKACDELGKFTHLQAMPAAKPQQPQAPPEPFDGQPGGGSGADDDDEEPGSVQNSINKAKAMVGGRSWSRMTAIDDDKGPAQDWNCLRKKCYWILHGSCGTQQGSETSVFDSVIGVLVVFNIIIMIIETDATATCELESPDLCIPRWAVVVNMILLGVYSLEAVLRMFVYRLSFFASKWNILDLSIVFCGVCGALLEDVDAFKRVNILRLLRVARIIRVAKILKRFPVLMNFIGGFVGAMQAMIWGLILILMMLVMWSLMAVELIYPESQKIEWGDGDPCKVAFESVWRSTLTLFQTLVAGDSWGACAIPIIDFAPYTYMIFALSLVTVQLGFTNLVLAVIVDKANEARELNKEERLKEKKKSEEACLDMWQAVMKSVDSDGNGTINEQELLEGYKIPNVRENLKELNIGQKDLKDLFRLMDCEDKGELEYDKFVDCFRKAQQQDGRVYMMFLQLRLQALEFRFRSFSEKQQAAPPADAQWMQSSNPPSSPVPSAPMDELGCGALPRRTIQPEGMHSMAAQQRQVSCQGSDAADEEVGRPQRAPKCKRAQLLSNQDDDEDMASVDSEELLQSLRESIDRRLDDIVAEVTVTATRSARHKARTWRFSATALEGKRDDELDDECRVPSQSSSAPSPAKASRTNPRMPLGLRPPQPTAKSDRDGDICSADSGEAATPAGARESEGGRGAGGCVVGPHAGASRLLSATT